MSLSWLILAHSPICAIKGSLWFFCFLINNTLNHHERLLFLTIARYIFFPRWWNAENCEMTMRGLLKPLYSTFLICPSALVRVLPCVWTCLSSCSPSCSGRWSSVWCALCCAAPCPSRSWRSHRWCCWSWCSEEQGAPLSRRCCHPGIYFLNSWNK